MRFRNGSRRSSSAAAFLSVCLAWPAYALGPALFPVSLQAAVRAIVLLHPELAQARFDLPVEQHAHEGEPVLIAGPLERAATGDARDARVRLHCQSSSVCLPFYVLAHLDHEIALADTPRAQLQAAHPAPILRSGAHATLLIDSGRLHLRLPVTCLQPGALGATIRVTSGAPGRKVYQAAILDAATVRGTL